LVSPSPETTIRQKISQAEIDLYFDMLAGLAWHPVFFVLVVVDDGDRVLERARATLLAMSRQDYPDWRLALLGGDSAVALCDRLVDGSDDVRALRDRLLGQGDDWQRLTERVLEGFDDLRGRVDVLPIGHRARIANLAGLAPAEERPLFLGVLAAGDELGCDALLEVSVTSGMHRGCDLFYSDEACTNPATGRVEAFLKPQWSPDLLLSTNYIGRFWCASRELFERSQTTVADLLTLGEFDVLLRCTEQSRGIRHIPSVLCQSTAGRLDGEAGIKRSLVRAIERRGIDGEIVAGRRPGTWRVKRRVVEQDLVSIVIPTCAARGLITTCIDTLRKTTAYRNFEIICVDNIPAADHQSKRWLRANADKVVEVEGPFNWSYFNNRGAAAAEGRFLLFLNDDVEMIDPGWLESLVEHAQRLEVGVVGALLLYPQGTVQHGGMFLAGLGHGRHAFRHRRHDDPGYFGLAQTTRNVTAVTGACLMTRNETFRDLGGFAEVHDITNNDLDYCLKARSRGLLCVFTPHARLVHHERGSRADTKDHYDQAAFDRQWRPLFGDGDPYHHPRLSSEVDDIIPEHEPMEVLCVGRPLFTRNEVRKILVLKLDHIGDCIGSIPALRRLRQVFPEARIHVLGGPWSRPIWSLVPEVDEFIAFDFFQARPLAAYKTLSDKDFQRLGQRLEPYRFDLAIDLRRHGDTRFLLRHIGARHLAGFKEGAEFPWLDIAVEWEGDLPGMVKRRHFSNDLVNLVDAIAVECEPGSDLLAEPLGSASLELLGDLDRPLVCVHPAAGDEIRRWPASHFAELIDLLVERDGVQVAIIGVAGDGEIATQVLQTVRHHNRVSNLTGKLEFSDLVALLSASALFVGNNSGPKHLAAGLGVPTVGIHSGNVDPREWGPAGRRAVAIWRRVRCAPCQLSRPEQCDRQLACLTELRPVDVYSTCKRLLAIRSARRSESLAGKALDRMYKQAAEASPGRGSESASSGRDVDDRRRDERTAPVAVADAAETPPAADKAPVAEDARWEKRVDRAEEKTEQLYKLAEAAQAAIDVLRAKLTHAEAEIDRIARGRVVVAEELDRKANQQQALDSLREGLELKCDAMETQVSNITRDRERLVAERTALERERDALAAEAFHLARDRERLVAERIAGLPSLTDAALDPLFWRPASLGVRSDWWGHVPFAHWLVRVAAPETFVELSTVTGVSYSAFCNAVLQAGLPTHCHAVATWRGDRRSSETADEVDEDFRRFHDRHYSAFSTLLNCKFDTAVDRFADGLIDLLHIDCRYSYEDLRNDFESWLPKLSNRGIVVLHSINAREEDFGIWRLWDELCRRYPSFEFVHGHGLGVLAVGAAVPAAVLAVCRLTDWAAIAGLRNRFAFIGERWAQIERLDASEAAVIRAQTEVEELSAQITALDSAMQGRTESLQAELERLAAIADDRARAAEMAENVAARKTAELNRARAEISALDAAMQTRVAALQTELGRSETMAADRARAADIAENAAALKAGELNRARAEITALSTRIPRAERGVARSWRQGGRLLRSHRRRIAQPSAATSEPIEEEPDGGS
jgi:ADP-heptose:LPS heptosyltransferase/GT2 family glycosyltransferase